MRFPALVATALLTLSPLTAMAAPLSVSVSIIPQQWLIKQLGQDSVDVQTMVLPGQEPEDFSPSPRQLSSLSHSRLYFSIGVPFEAAWLDRFAERAPDMNIVSMDKNVAHRSIESHDEPSHHDGEAHNDHHAHDDHHHGHEAASGHHHEAGAPDPHIWLDPNNMIIMAHNAADALVNALPDQAGAIRQRESALVDEIKQTDQQITRQLMPYKGRSFMVYHPAWGYFADHYHLNQHPIELNGREPTPRALHDLMTTARKNGIHTIFVQKQFSQATARRLAESLDGNVVSIDPLAEDYPANLHRIADALVAGFEKATDSSS
ncbi:metal ABC transporter solute-binding protein, Zn/Mn family [Larsenimonas rhizosphaerae]|uniref:High-affinity zinc uptake system protein ZnuA n=1 Tax=Larsenimonas rhizosphaerae TaxID=2944682 RepID=A0AA42CX30_9GAMM|nr:zinc ABC transporter substrate-binding protein [Larsenimonas rhizosphaerae]MCM2130696.1 zinc ABC transporter substrate-binding protein [Larsenimonas rhizosphaerae]MCX2523400.1 zinc ABC transporter substrate-binding protein [Larsenimonas rhizosphaerae]